MDYKNKGTEKHKNYKYCDNHKCRRNLFFWHITKLVSNIIQFNYLLKANCAASRIKKERRRTGRIRKQDTGYPYFAF